YLERAFGLRRSTAGLEPASQEKAFPLAVIQPFSAGPDLALHHQWEPDFRRVVDFETDETGLRNADDGEAATVDDQLAAHHRRVGPETPLEALVTEDRDRMCARRAIIFGRDHATEHSLCSQRIEVIARYQIAPDTLVDAGMAQADGRHRIRDQPVQNPVPVAQVPVVEIREQGRERSLFRCRHSRIVDRNDSPGLRYGERAQQNFVYQTEDRRVRADTQREGDDGNQGEA